MSVLINHMGMARGSTLKGDGIYTVHTTRGRTNAISCNVKDKILNNYQHKMVTEKGTLNDTKWSTRCTLYTV
jgi:hypothetical protein